MKLYSAAMTLIKAFLALDQARLRPAGWRTDHTPLAHERNRTWGILLKHTLRLEDRYQVRRAQTILFHQKLERPT
jgi:hypothetical protein